MALANAIGTYLGAHYQHSSFRGCQAQVPVGVNPSVETRPGQPFSRATAPRLAPPCVALVVGGLGLLRLSTVSASRLLKLETGEQWRAESGMEWTQRRVFLVAALVLCRSALAAADNAKAHSFSNEFAVFVPAGPAVADQLAAKHGFR